MDENMSHLICNHCSTIPYKQVIRNSKTKSITNHSPPKLTRKIQYQLLNHYLPLDLWGFLTKVKNIIAYPSRPLYSMSTMISISYSVSILYKFQSKIALYSRY